MPDLGNVFGHLKARQLPALPRFRPLGDFDLQLVGVGQVMTAHAEPAGGHLLDLAAARIAVGIGDIPYRVFTAFTRIAFASQAVHGNGQGFMRLAGNRPDRHRPGAESFGDLFDRFHFLEGNRLPFFKPEQSAQGAVAGILLVADLRVFLKQ